MHFEKRVFKKILLAQTQRQEAADDALRDRVHQLGGHLEEEGGTGGGEAGREDGRQVDRGEAGGQDARAHQHEPGEAQGGEQEQGGQGQLHVASGKKLSIDACCFRRISREQKCWVDVLKTKVFGGFL